MPMFNPLRQTLLPVGSIGVRPAMARGAQRDKVAGDAIVSPVVDVMDVQFLGTMSVAADRTLMPVSFVDSRSERCEFDRIGGQAFSAERADLTRINGPACLGTGHPLAKGAWRLAVISRKLNSARLTPLWRHLHLRSWRQESATTFVAASAPSSEVERGFIGPALDNRLTVFTPLGCDLYAQLLPGSITTALDAAHLSSTKLWCLLTCLSIERFTAVGARFRRQVNALGIPVTRPAAIALLCKSGCELVSLAAHRLATYDAFFHTRIIPKTRIDMGVLDG